LKRAYFAFALILVIVGLVVASYSYGKVTTETTLYSHNSIELDTESYYIFNVGVNSQGKYEALLKGYVGSVGCCIDYCLINDSIEPTWVASNASMKIELSSIHLNSTQISSQSLSGQFSFVPHASDGYSVFLANDNYPKATNATVDSDFIFQYSSYEWLYYTIAGLVVFLTGLLLAIIWAIKPTLTLRPRNQKLTDRLQT
jgi:hypothetical protein